MPEIFFTPEGPTPPPIAMTEEQLRVIAEMDRLEPHMIEAFLAANNRVVDAVSVRELQAALATGSVFLAAASLPVELFERAFAIANLEVIDAAVRAGGATAIETLLADVAESYFNPLDDVAVTWTKLLGADITFNVTEESQETIRVAIARIIDGDLSPAQGAKYIKSAIGLNRPQEQALWNYRQTLKDEGLGVRRIEELIGVRRDAMLDSRAQMIARTEVSKAVNAGRNFAWEQGVEGGFIDPNVWEREWETEGDGHVCRICAPLHGVRSPIGGTYNSIIGPLDHAPAHPSCRCDDKLVKKKKVTQ